MSQLRHSPEYVELIDRARTEGADLMAVLLTHVGWNKSDGYLTITERTSAVGREAFAAIGCPDVGPTGLPIHEVFSRAVRLAAEQGHAPLSRAISGYAADVWTDGFVPPSEADLMAESSTADVEPATAPPLQSDRVEFVAPEASDIIEYSVSPRSGEKARREESQLVKRFESWLTSQGHQIERARIRPIGEADDLEAVALALNNRPRKSLDWKTPAEVLEEQLRSIHQPGVATTG